MSKRTKRTAHAVLLAVGVGGLLHLISLFTLAIQKGQPRYANPAYAVDLDQVFPSLNGATWFFVVGWLSFIIMIIVAYFVLVYLDNKK